MSQNTTSVSSRALESSPLFQPHHYLALAFAPITWNAFGYHFMTMIYSIIGFTYVVTAVSLGLSLALIVLGLFVGAACVVAARGLGASNRVLTNSMLGTSIAPPIPFTLKRGDKGFVRAGLADSAGWRAMAYMFVSFIWSIFAFCVSVTFLALGLGGVTYGLWYRWLPAQQASDGTWHKGSQIFNNYFIDTPARVVVFSLVCAVIFFWVWPILNNSMAKVQARMAASLLGPTDASLERQQLLVRQAEAAQSTDNRMRSIERDLHDVTQAQLVAIAMKVGDVKERLAAGEPAENVLSMLESAHGTSKDALTDLRGLVQGIHPAALNDGLATALSTLASTSAISVRLELDLQQPVAPIIESVAYYSVSELITNAAKHSGAREVIVSAQTDPEADSLRIAVIDHGHGGAALRGVQSLHGTGLDGVASRVATVGGRFEVNSPEGGPTVAELELPRELKVEG